MSETERQEVCQRLLDNARRASEEHRDEVMGWPSVVSAQGKFLPGYIPYIGDNYFGRQAQGCRILIYALSQNLRDSESYTQALAGNWEWAIDRQNNAWKEHDEAGKAAMQPFDTGHLPILAALLRSRVVHPGAALSDSIYSGIAATNLSKFSFRVAGQTTDNDTSLRCCWQWFSRLEVEVLRPNYIICCGPRVFQIVKTGVAELYSEGTDAPVAIWVPFPSMRVINRHFRKTLQAAHLGVEQLVRLLPPVDCGRTVYRGASPSVKVREVVEKDRYYFAEVLCRMEKQIVACRPH